MSFEEKMGKYILSSSHVSISQKGENNKSTVQSTQINQVITSTSTTTTTTITKSSTSSSTTTTTTTSTKTEIKAVKVYTDKDCIISSSSSICDSDKDKDKQADDTDLFSRNEMVIMKALIFFNKANNEPNISNFIPRIPNYINKENVQSEKELYTAIDRLIQNKLIEQQSFSITDLLFSSSFSSSNNSNDGSSHQSSQSYANIDKLISKSKETNTCIEFIAIKAIMISLINIINERLQKVFKLNFSGDTFDVDCDIFNDIYNEYIILSDIYLFLERDFALSLNCFKSKYEMKFSFKDLFRDIYWDYVFKIKQLNCLFVDYFNSNRLSKRAQNTMKNIIKELWFIDIPLKKSIGVLLDITSIKVDKCFFACYVIEYKSQVLSEKKDTAIALSLIEPIDNNISNNNNGNSNNSNYQLEQESHSKLDEMMICEHHLNTECNNDNNADGNESQSIMNNSQRFNHQAKTQLRSLSQDKEIKHSLIKCDFLQEDMPLFLDQCNLAINENQSAAKLIESLQLKESKFIKCLSNNDCNPRLEHFDLIENSNANTNTNDNIKQNNNSNSNSVNGNNDKFKSIDELYDYIVNDQSNSKKRNKKKGKPNKIANTPSNTNNYINISNCNNSNAITELDAIVEQFKVDLDIMALNASNVQKIKPMISIEWLKSIAST